MFLLPAPLPRGREGRGFRAGGGEGRARAAAGVGRRGTAPVRTAARRASAAVEAVRPRLLSLVRGWGCLAKGAGRTEGKVLGGARGGGGSCCARGRAPRPRPRPRVRSLSSDEDRRRRSTPATQPPSSCEPTMSLRRETSTCRPRAVTTSPRLLPWHRAAPSQRIVWFVGRVSLVVELDPSDETVDPDSDEESADELLFESEEVVPEVLPLPSESSSESSDALSSLSPSSSAES